MPGRLPFVVAGRLIHDHLPFGILSVRDVLAKSSDVGTIKIALKLGAPRFYDTMRDFGIGQLTGIELPRERTAGCCGPWRTGHRVRSGRSQLGRK